MSDNSMLPPPGGQAAPRTAVARPDPQQGRALLAAVLIVAGSAVIGVAGGLIWAAVAPRAVYQVATLGPPVIAYATNPESNAFFAPDGLYCFIALAGGALIGLFGYLLAVRRYGPVPMVGVIVGATCAALIAEWLGPQASGSAGFDHVLATSKIGEYVRSPISLGSHGALAFWPVAAAAVAGGIELVTVLRVRHRPAYGGMPMPGMDSVRTPPRHPRAEPGSALRPAPMASPEQAGGAIGPEPGAAEPDPRDTGPAHSGG